MIVEGQALIPDLKQVVYDVFASTPGTSFVTLEGNELDRSAVLNASEAGTCLRRIVFSKANPDVVEASFATLDRAGYAERGKAVEEWFNARFDEHNKLFPERGLFTYYGKRQRSFMYRKLSATPDGIYTVGRKSWNIDVKSVDPRTNRARLPLNSHVIQVKQAAYILDAVTPYNIAGSILLYVDASNFGDIKQIHVPRDPTFGEWIEARAEIALSKMQPNQVKAEGLLTERGCDYCPFTSECSAAMEVNEHYLVNLAEAERAMSHARQSEEGD